MPEPSHPVASSEESSAAPSHWPRWPLPPFLQLLAWSRGPHGLAPPADGSARTFGAWAFRAAWWSFGPRWLALTFIGLAAVLLVAGLAVEVFSPGSVRLPRLIGASLLALLIAPYALRLAITTLTATAASGLASFGPVLRASAHFWADLQRTPYEVPQSTPAFRVVRMLVFTPAPALRLFLIVIPLGVVACAVGTNAPSVAERFLEASWVWTVPASAGLALVFGLRACGVRYHHPVDPGIGGGSSVIVAVMLSAAFAGAIVLGTRPGGVMFTFVGLAVGGFLAGVSEALIRGPRGAGLRVARVPLGYERDLVFIPVGAGPADTRWDIRIERRSPLDPLHTPDPDAPDAATLTLLPHPDDARETYTCDRVYGDGADAIARAIIFACWGIEQAHLGDVRRVAWALLEPMAVRETFRVPFARLIDVGVSAEPEVEAGLRPVWPRTTPIGG